MKTLVQLARIVSKNKIKSIQILDHQIKSDRLYDFYERILNEELKSDQEAARFYFGSEADNYKYRKLKNRLRDRLYNTLFFIDTSSPKFNEHQRAFYTCQKYLITIKLLLARYARKSAIQLMRKTLKQAEKYEFTMICLELYELLRSHYALMDVNRSKYDRAVRKVKFYETECAAEKICDEMHQDFSLIVAEGKMLPSAIIKIGEDYADKFNELYGPSRTFRFYLVYFFFQIQLAKIKGDYKLLIEICDNAIKQLSAKPFVSKHFIGVFHYNRLQSYIQLQDYTSAEKIADVCLTYFEKDTVRWFNIQDYYFILCMHTKRYQEAYLVFRTVFQNKHFPYQFQNKDEVWYTKQAYLYYLLKIQKLALPPHNALSRFRLQKFLNQVPAFSMKKRLENIPILLVQILILILEKDYDRLSSRIDAVEKYTSRYLRKDENFRSNCFIKMLLEIPKRNFHRRAVERHAKKYVQKLSAVPLQIADQPFEIEIIPYEDLWEYTLGSLGAKS